MIRRRILRYKDSTWMEQKYVKEGLSSYDIGRLCNLSSTQVRYWCRKHGIVMRAKDDHLKKLRKAKYDELFKQVLMEVLIDLTPFLDNKKL